MDYLGISLSSNIFGKLLMSSSMAWVQKKSWNLSGKLAGGQMEPSLVGVLAGVTTCPGLERGRCSPVLRLRLVVADAAVEVGVAVAGTEGLFSPLPASFLLPLLLLLWCHEIVEAAINSLGGTESQRFSQFSRSFVWTTENPYFIVSLMRFFKRYEKLKRRR